MPVYDYDCAACGRRFEVVHGVHVPGPASCPLCGKGPVRKAISAPAVHYKGSGWAKKERRAAVTSGASRATADTTTTAGDGSKSDSDAKSDANSKSDPDGRSNARSKSDSDAKSDARSASEDRASGSTSATSKTGKADAAKPAR